VEVEVAITLGNLLVLSLVAFLLLIKLRARETPTLYCMSQSLQVKIVDLTNFIFVAPAEADIEYETIVFHNTFGGDRTPYQGPPTDAVDEAWEKLYHSKAIQQVKPSQYKYFPLTFPQILVSFRLTKSLRINSRMQRWPFPGRTISILLE
jgi:hypothetical protein